MSTTVRPSASQNTSAPGNRGHAAPALSGVLRAAARDSKLKGLVTHVGAAQLAIQGPDAVWPFAVGTIAQHAPVLVITATARQAEDLTEQLKAMLGDEVELMPAWETLPHERISPNVETVSQRMKVLRRLHRQTAGELGESESRIRVVVAPVRTLVQPIQDSLGAVTPVHLAVDQEVDFEQIQHELVERGYSAVDVVAKRGHFAVRGGILDVFPATGELPVRVEFWGDEVSDIRPFSVGDQRTVPGVELDEITVYPARELLITDSVATRAGELNQ